MSAKSPASPQDLTRCAKTRNDLPQTNEELDALAYRDSPIDMTTGHKEAIHPLPYFLREETLSGGEEIVSILCPCNIDRPFDKLHVGIVVEVDNERVVQRAKFDVGEARCTEYL